MNRATCRGCGAPIVWIKTPAGKAMPCDPAPVYYKAAPGGKDKIVTTRGYQNLIRGALTDIPCLYAYIFTDWRM